MGLDLYLEGRAGDKQKMQEFIILQKKIWDETGPFPFTGEHYVWGTIPSEKQWNGIYVQNKPDCNTQYSCRSQSSGKSRLLPYSLLYITPNRPKEGWEWVHTNLTIYMQHNIPVVGPVGWLNSDPLNWLQMGN